jgi:predicted nucleotidyltransferase
MTQGMKGLYNLIMSMTALDLSPEALKKYRPLDAIRKRRAKSSAEIASRRRRAHLVARKAAKLLKSEFGATEVILFGSLARRVGFTRWSDIDLASRGIPSDKYLTAMDTVLYLSPEFKIDLVELETCSPSLLKSIEKEGKPL